METGELALWVLVLAPILGSAAGLVAPRKAQGAVVGAVAASIIVASLALTADLAGRGFAVLEAFPPVELGTAVEALGLLLAAVFLYLGWRARSWLIAALAVAELVLLAVLALGQPADPGPAVLVDSLALILILITSTVGSLIVLYSLRYMREDERRGRFLAVMLLFLGAMNAAVACNDLLWLDLFWGLTTLCSFLLIGYDRTDEARTAARLALVINLGGGAALLLGALLLQQLHGTTELSALPEGADGLVLLPFALLAVAGLTKSAQVPFQSWLLRAMVAPTPVSALLHSSTMVNLGVFLLLRLAPGLQDAGALSWALALIGGVSFLVTSVLAITQSSAKRVLAYSTVGNLGLIVMCVGIATPLAVTAGVVLLLYHAVSKALLFLAVGVVKEERGTECIEDMHGLRNDLPMAALALFVGVATLVLPPFGMFVSKWLISEAVVTFPLLIFVLAVGFAAIVVYYFKWIGVVVSSGAGERPRRLRDDPSAPSYRWSLGLLAAGAVVLSLAVGPVVRYLVLPFVQRFYELPVSTDDLSLFTGLGVFPVFLFLVLAALVFIALGWLVRPRRDERRATPYACGESYEFQLGGAYYLTDRWADLATKAGNAVGVVLIAALLLVPVLLEVL